VQEPLTTAQLVERITTAAATLVLHESAEQPLAACPLPAAGDLLLVVGPEGGITDRELATLSAAGGTAVRLGPSVLRTSTAGAAAVAVVSALTSRWG
jgi:16S rRNA (uracil1498-N3)-methyltransferase